VFNDRTCIAHPFGGPDGTDDASLDAQVSV
jgi:hypothetical protein